MTKDGDGHGKLCWNWIRVGWFVLVTMETTRSDKNSKSFSQLEWCTLAIAAIGMQIQRSMGFTVFTPPSSSLQSLSRGWKRSIPHISEDWRQDGHGKIRQVQTCNERWHCCMVISLICSNMTSSRSMSSVSDCSNDDEAPSPARARRPVWAATRGLLGPRRRCVGDWSGSRDTGRHCPPCSWPLRMAAVPLDKARAAPLPRMTLRPR